MKTREMLATLQAFAKIAAPHLADELRRFAELFQGGKEETVTARVRRAEPPLNYPSALKDCIASIEEALTKCGAKKQAADFKAILSIFSGRPGSTVEQFLEQVRVSLERPSSKSPKKVEAATPDRKMARELADELTRNISDPGRFSSLVEILRNPKSVSTPTLALTANMFLGNEKRYKGRKPAIEDVIKRHKEDARFAARGRALNEVGV